LSRAGTRASTPPVQAPCTGEERSALIEIGTVEIDQNDFVLPETRISTEIGCFRREGASFR